MSNVVSPFESQRVVLRLAYLGPAFSGSQFQENAYTVQQALQEALTKLQVPFSGLTFAGRTDAGVHARGQVAHFDTVEHALDPIPDLVAALNGVLPNTVSISAATCVADPNFHATRSARWRWYRYRLFNHPVRSVWMRPDAVWLRAPLEGQRMQQAAEAFLGRHDFTSFCKARSLKAHTECEVLLSRLTREAHDWVYDVVANRFVHMMVRTMVGTLIEIGRRQTLSPKDVPEILRQKQRKWAGPTAKPEGLSLMAVYYPHTGDFFQNDVYVTTLKQLLQEFSDEKELFSQAP